MSITCPECAKTYFDHAPYEVEMIFIDGHDEPDYFICLECGHKILAFAVLAHSA